MAMKVIITGSTGMVGKGVLYECLENPAVSDILIINRTSIGITSPKLKELIIPDFFDLENSKNEMKGYDACFFCLGVSSFRMPEETYSHLTYDLGLNFAKKFLEQNRDSHFCYVSATGSDSSEKGSVMWARVRGRLENALFKMDFKSVKIFRPGFIQPLDGIRSKTKMYNLLYFLFKPFYGILKHYPKLATNTQNMGRAMIHAVEMNEGEDILNNLEINKLANI